jgi:hypothetical protein
VDLYIHSPIPPHGIVLTWLSTGTTYLTYILHYIPEGRILLTYRVLTVAVRSWGRSVRIVTGYGLGGLGIEVRFLADGNRGSLLFTADRVSCGVTWQRNCD